MWLAICEPADTSCLWAVAGLRRLGVEPLEVVLPAELMTGVDVAHHIDSAAASVRIHLRDGRQFSTGQVNGVLNRLLEVPATWLAGFAGRDAGYVAEETQALLASALGILGGAILNPPDPANLSGRWFGVAEWRWRAAHAGLPALPFRVGTWEEPAPPEPSERRSLLVVDGEVCGPGTPDRALVEGCVALARDAAVPLLGIDMAVGPDGTWVFDRATGLPDLRTGGLAGLRALKRALGA
jgi:hypothetical protein